MTKRLGILVCAGLVAIGTFAFRTNGNKSESSGQGGSSCDYACLIGMVDQYMKALVAQRPSSVEMGEFFKIEHGKIREIEGLSIALPYGQHSGWEAAD